MAKHPDDRYPSAQAVLHAIETARAVLPEAGLAA
jgi:hypothetical protein